MKLPLAIALALAAGNALALGLGPIRVKSGLNQPLDAEIPVITDSAAEVNALSVDLASAEDFQRIGLSRARLGVDIDMMVTTDARGQTVVKLTTKEPVREPLLDFLLVANWPKGKLLREFTVLLDPPVTAPVAKAGPATVAPVAEKPAAAPQPLAQPKAPPAKAARPEPKPPVAATKPAPMPKPSAPAPAPKAAPAASAPGGNDYGPVAAGETLSEIARATRPDEKTNIDRMMLALLKANPNAFYQDNINALKRGAILRIPSSDEVNSVGSIREAMDQVHSQNDSWSGKAPVAAPTLVAHTGEPAAKPAAATNAEPKSPKQERLALVPPSAGKGSSGVDRAGTAAGTGRDNADVRAELARTKESLTSREQEASELKSRVKQLEDINSKDQRLISMKDSEIADLQKKLRDLQAKAAAPAAKTPEPATAKTETPPAPAATSRPEQKITAKDIWGDLNASEKPPAKTAATTTPQEPAAATPATGTAPATSATTPAPGAPSTAAAPGSSPSTTAGTTAPAATPGETAPATMPPPATATATPPKPAPKVTPVKPTPAAKVTPLEPAAEPFWRNQNVLLGGGALLVLVGVLALVRFMRKPKPATVLDDGDAGYGEDEELRLRDALQQNPANMAAALELLRHYYSRGDAVRFEAAAESMHAHLPEPNAPEWDEVVAMGSVLAPNHPLFSAAAAEPPLEEALHTEPPPSEDFDYPEADEAMHHAEGMHEADAADVRHEDSERTLIGSFEPEPAPVEFEHAAPAPAADDGFDFDFPLASEESPPQPEHEHVVEVAPEPVFEHAAEADAPAARNDDIYVGEDAIGTKLDLAKAYLDMGDPEGAKSMLDEVMAEGNETQRDEARKLIAEIR